LGLMRANACPDRPAASRSFKQHGNSPIKSSEDLHRRGSGGGNTVERSQQVSLPPRKVGPCQGTDRGTLRTAKGVPQSPVPG
jgi:hypothetical protein